MNITFDRKRLIELLALLFIPFIPIAIQLLLSINSSKTSTDSTYENVIYSIIIAQCILAILLITYFLRQNNNSFKSIGVTFRLRKKDIYHAIILLIISWLTRNLLSNTLYSHFPELFTPLANNAPFHFTNIWQFILISIILLIHPIMEELVFRGYTMSEVVHMTNSKHAAILTSVSIQFLYHLSQGFIYAVVLIPVFLIHSLYFVKTENLNATIYSSFLFYTIATLTN